VKRVSDLERNKSFIASRLNFIKLAVPLMALLLVSCESKPPPEEVSEVVVEPADLVLINGGVYTGDAGRNIVQAAAVRDGVFVLVGRNEEIEPLVGPHTRTIDLAGQWASPGFHDAHVHPMMGGYALMGCDLESYESVKVLISAVTQCAAESDSGWLEGHAFDLALFGQDGPNKSLLDAIDTQRPIILWASDGHNAWANSRALELAGITADTMDPPLGVIERNPDGSPSGTLRETAQELIRTVMPAPTPAANREALQAGIDYLNAQGITSFIDAWVGREDYQAYQALDREGKLTARVVTCLVFGSGFAKHSGDEFEQVLVERKQYESERLNTDCIKFFVDGVLEGETAALLEPYLGFGDYRGDLILDQEELNAAATRFDAMGMQIHMHAIGDRAVRAGLDAIEVARQQNGITDNRHHISHLQLISIDDIERFAELDTAANFQAVWAYPDDWIMELNLPVVGEERVQGMYPIASVERSGGRIVGGSDWNVSTANPLIAMENGVRRQDVNEDDGPALNESERVSLATMVDAFTANGAWLMHQENITGSIEIGKQADIVVLDRDPFQIPATELSEAQVVMTLLDGEVVYFNQDIEMTN
jgi:predicted amidohydrolase YtcJ